MENLKEKIQFNLKQDNVPKKIICDNFNLLCGSKSELGIINPDLRLNFIRALTNGKVSSVNTISNWFREEGETSQSKLRIPTELLIEAAKIIGENPDIFLEENSKWFIKKRDDYANKIASYMAAKGISIVTVPKNPMEKLKMGLNRIGVTYADIQKNIDRMHLGPKTFMVSIGNKIKFGSVITSQFYALSKGSGMLFEEEFTAHDGSKIKFINNQDRYAEKLINFMVQHSHDKVTKEDLYNIIKKNEGKYNKGKTNLDDLNLIDKKEIAAASGGKYDCFFVCPDGKVY